ncbi:MAG: PIG-L family deacetylase, partial [Calditrichaeota bacterium]
FGSSPRRGPRKEYFLLRLGDLPKTDPFADDLPTWQDFPAGAAVQASVDSLLAHFDPENPSASVPGLVALYRQLAPLATRPRVAEKMALVRELIRNCAGLWLEALAPHDQVAPGDSLTLRLRALNRSTVPLRLVWIALPALGWRQDVSATLGYQSPVAVDTVLPVPASLPYSLPYWLEKLPRGDLYTISSPEALFQPENPPPLEALFTIQVEGTTLDFAVPVLYRWTDPVLGERFRTTQIAPEVVWDVDTDVLLFPTREPRQVELRLRSTRGDLAGTAALRVPSGWRVEPPTIPVHFSRPNQQQTLRFVIHPPENSTVEDALPVANVNGKKLSFRSFDLAYQHIRPQRIYLSLPIRLARLELAAPVRRVGYIMGSGDRIPEFLRQLGITVELLDDETLLHGDLNRYPAIVAGIRAYNTRPVLQAAYPRLMAYVRAGGTYLVQYNTAHRLVTDSIGPYPLHLSRQRITDEQAVATFLDSSHPALVKPNPIDAADFEGWVQERGLYFPDRWDAHYRPLLRFADPGEAPLDGSLLVARYGKGWFVYTGLAFFRQLPAGVPGAYRLFMNLISLSTTAGTHETR